MSTDPRPSEPALTKTVEKTEKEEGMLKSVYDRINSPAGLKPRSEISKEAANAIAVTTAVMKDVGLVVNSNLPYREQIKQLKGKLGIVAESQVSIEELGHSILDGLAEVMPDAAERGSLEAQLKAADDAEPALEREDETRRMELMYEILDTGFVLPSKQSAEEISKKASDGGHRYFTITEGILRVNTINVDRDIRTLGGKEGKNALPPFSNKAGREVLATFIAKLEALKNVDTINRLGFTPPQPTKIESAIMQRGKKSMKLLLIGLLAFGAVMSLAIERNRKFPFFTLMYGGLALALARPDLFKGSEQVVARQLNFTIEDPRWKAMMEDPDTKAKLNEDFILSMTEDADIRAQSLEVAKNDGDEEKVKEYFEFLRDNGVKEEHIVFLTDLKKEKPSQFSFITAALSQISDEGARYSLVGFAQQGISTATLAQIKPPDGAENTNK
ncbi:MAG: hypothetical protein O2904_02050 [bacterium]|nr:hypothetical protein [bacterium]